MFQRRIHSQEERPGRQKLHPISRIRETPSRCWPVIFATSLMDNYSMGGDPLPGMHQYLRIFYVVKDGERRNIVVDEKTDLRLALAAR
jgi:hypothetical protein